MHKFVDKAWILTFVSNHAILISGEKSAPGYFQGRSEVWFEPGNLFIMREASTNRENSVV